MALYSFQLSPHAVPQVAGASAVTIVFLDGLYCLLRDDMIRPGHRLVERIFVLNCDGSLRSSETANSGLLRPDTESGGTEQNNRVNTKSLKMADSLRNEALQCITQGIEIVAMASNLILACCCCRDCV